jgi:Resolvase, N terminal domain
VTRAGGWFESSQTRRWREMDSNHRFLPRHPSRRGTKEAAGGDPTTPAGSALFQMLGGFAEFECAIIQERIHTGIARREPKVPAA